MTLGSSIIVYMEQGQGTLFDTRRLKGQLRQGYAVTPPTAAMTIHATLPAYHTYLSSAGYSVFTPDDFTADLRLFGQFTASKPLADIKPVDIQQWIAKLKETMPPKTVSRKISAISNYFRWLEAEHITENNPAKHIRPPRVAAPLQHILFDSDCDRLLAVASKDPRTYLLVLLLLETGLKTAELFSLQVNDFDFSNKYQPELWVRHSNKQVFKDRRLKLPTQVVEVFRDYLERYKATDLLFPYSQRFISMLLNGAAKEAKVTKQVNIGVLRDTFVLHSVRHGAKLEDVFEKIGLAKSSYDDARKKYGRLTKEAL